MLPLRSHQAARSLGGMGGVWAFQPGELGSDPILPLTSTVAPQTHPWTSLSLRPQLRIRGKNTYPLWGFKMIPTKPCTEGQENPQEGFIRAMW